MLSVSEIIVGKCEGRPRLTKYNQSCIHLKTLLQEFLISTAIVLLSPKIFKWNYLRIQSSTIFLSLKYSSFSNCILAIQYFLDRK